MWSAGGGCGLWEWVESMGVVSRRWMWVESMGVVVRMYIDYHILLIPTPLVLYLFFFAAAPYFLFI